MRFYLYALIILFSYEAAAVRSSAADSQKSKSPYKL